MDNLVRNGELSLSDRYISGGAGQWGEEWETIRVRVSSGKITRITAVSLPAAFFHALYTAPAKPLTIKVDFTEWDVAEAKYAGAGVADMLMKCSVEVSISLGEWKGHVPHVSKNAAQRFLWASLCGRFNMSSTEYPFVLPGSSDPLPSVKFPDLMRWLIPYGRMVCDRLPGAGGDGWESFTLNWAATPLPDPSAEIKQMPYTKWLQYETGQS